MILLINTSVSPAAVALVHQEKLLDQRSVADGPTLSAHLLETIDTLLATSGVTWPQIERIAVHQGPGGYSRLRVGAVTGVMLSLAHAKELVAVQGETMAEVIQAAHNQHLVNTVELRYQSPGIA
jgi:tRNA threonylcarbamoyl adenosine modification protein YeaZ